MPLLADAVLKLKPLLRSRLLVNARHYLAANLISGMIPFLLLPVLTRHLSPEDFGAVALFTALSAVASALFALGVNGAISRIYFDLADDEFGAFVGTCLGLVAICTASLSLVIVLLGDLIADVTSFPVNWLWAVTITACAQAAFNVGLAVFQVRGEVHQFAIAQVAQAALLAVLTLAAVVAMSFDWRGRVVSQVLSTSVTTLGVLFYLFKFCNIPFRFETKYARQALRYGLPLVIHVLSGVTIALADRFIMARLLTLRETGLYAVAAQITAILVFVIDAFNRAYSPWLFSVLTVRDPGMCRKVVKGSYVYFLGVFLFAMAFAVVAAGLLGFLLGEGYEDSSRYLLWMALSAAFMGMYYMVTLYIQFAKRTEYLAWITVVVGIGNVICCYVFVDLWGGIGAAYASALAQSCMFLASWVVAAHLVPMPWIRPGWGAGRVQNTPDDGA